MIPVIEVHAVETVIRTERGDSDARDPAGLVDASLESGSTDQIVFALAAAAAVVVRDDPERGSALLVELEQTPGAHDTPYYARQLPAMVRTAISAGEVALGKRLADGLEPLYPLHEHASCAARAQLAEAAGQHVEAAALYGEAAMRWQSFGSVPERAYALLGEGRCLVALGQPAAERPLDDARQLFQSMRYKPALAETEALLTEAVAAAS
jgi:hypothetical protein